MLTRDVIMPLIIMKMFSL